MFHPACVLFTDRRRPAMTTRLSTVLAVRVAGLWLLLPRTGPGTCSADLLAVAYVCALQHDRFGRRDIACP
jgi:hypothetical protein